MRFFERILPLTSCRDNSRWGNLQAADGAETIAQFTVVPLKKPPNFDRRILIEPNFPQLPDDGVILFCRGTVSVAPAFEPPQVAVELRADVVQLVNDRFQFHREFQIHESRNTDIENVKIIPVARLMRQPLNLPLFAVVETELFSSFESERRQRSVNAVRTTVAGLRKTDGDPIHSDMSELRHPKTNVFAKPANGVGVVE